MLGHAKAMALFMWVGAFLVFGCLLPWIVVGVYIFKSFSGKCI